MNKDLTESVVASSPFHFVSASARLATYESVRNNQNARENVLQLHCNEIRRLIDQTQTQGYKTNTVKEIPREDEFIPSKEETSYSFEQKWKNLGICRNDFSPNL